ncbi:MAG: HAMP domain-containing histidine kinase [Cyclobacteriaceae bacterium]|nr:HAMP domain-containing histidine kinase [Cyclobacteriaceae bacterium]
MNFTDEELLQELVKRFENSNLLIAEQKNLMSQLEKMNEKLLGSEKVQSMFLSNIRNEINNPLTSIMGLANELMGHLKEDQGFQKKAELIYNEGFLLEFQLANIFIAAEMEAGETTPHIVQVNIENLISNTINSYQHLLDKKKLRVKLESTLPKNEKFKTDAEKFKTILCNLLMNAIEFSPSESNIDIKISINAERILELNIIDKGIGIPEESIEVIFDRFVQLDSGSTKLYMGHGIGLTVVKSILEFLEGGIELSSKINQGSTFTVHLPESHTSDEMDEFAQDGNEFMFFDEDMEDL